MSREPHYGVHWWVEGVTFLRLVNCRYLVTWWILFFQVPWANSASKNAMNHVVHLVDLGRERQMFDDLPRLSGYVEELEVMGPFYGKLVACYVGSCSRSRVEGPPAEGVCKDEVLAGLVGYFDGAGVDGSKPPYFSGAGAKYGVFADTGVQYSLGGMVVSVNPY